MQLKTEATAIDAGIVAIAQPPHIVHSQEGENVVKAHTNLHVGLLAHGLAQGHFGDPVQVRVENWIVLVGQTAPPPSDRHHLAHLQLLD